MIDLYGEAVDNYTASKFNAAIGTYRQSSLTEAQFNESSLGQWMLCDGRSCIGTAYHAITGNETVPDAKTEGTFFRQAKSGRALGSYEADEFKSHTHNYQTSRALDSSGRSNAYIGYGQNSYRANYSGKIFNTGGDESRPKNIATNFFIKVNY